VFAGVYNEYIIKKVGAEVDIMVQVNIQATCVRKALLEV
jgi:hypothetical protein